MKKGTIVLLVILALHVVSCTEKKGTLISEQDKTTLVAKSDEQSRIGKLNDAMINQYVANYELDAYGVNFLSLPGANDFVKGLDLSSEEIKMIGSWYNEDQYTGSVKFYPNRIVIFNRVDTNVNLLGFIGFWKVVNGNVLVKAIGYYYSGKTNSQLTEDINAGKYKNADRVITIYDIAKLYRYKKPEWKIFFNLDKLDEANYTYQGFAIPQVPDSLSGKKDTLLPVVDGRRLRLTSDPVNNTWKDVLNSSKYTVIVPDDAADDILLQYFKP